MLQKLLLAAAMTFTLNLFLGTPFAANTQSTTQADLAEMPSVAYPK